MKLSAVITEYRNRIQISQREFSRRCGLSNSYISFIENEMNPRTGRPIVPTIEQYHKLAAGMDMTVQQLFEMLDEDSPVDLHVVPSDPEPSDIDPEIHIVSGMMETMTKEQKQQVIDLVRILMKTQK